jgi:TPR repeat protein
MESGVGEIIDKRLALKFYLKSAEQNDAEAVFWIGALFMNGYSWGVTDAENGLEDDPDDDEDLEDGCSDYEPDPSSFNKQQEDANSSSTSASLANKPIYISNLTASSSLPLVGRLKKDLEKAILNYKKAALLGLPKAMTSLSLAYRSGAFFYSSFGDEGRPLQLFRLPLMRVCLFCFSQAMASRRTPQPHYRGSSRLVRPVIQR